MSRANRAAWLAVIALVLLPVRRAAAQSVQSRVLQGVSIERIQGDHAVRIRFLVPILYLRHAPLDHGDALDIQLAPLQGGFDAALGTGRESLRVPRGMDVPLDSITLDLEADTGPVVEVRFERPLHYTVEQGKDLRSLVVRVSSRDLLPAGAPRARTPLPPKPQQLSVPPVPMPATPGAPASEREQLMQEGRRALTAGEFERASALFTKLLSLPEGPDTPEALELLALSRERKGQRAHAKAEYEQYLARYPDGEGADRVRQRLEALITAREAPPARPAATAKRPERRRIDFQSFGSLYAAYRYDGRSLDASGAETLDNSIFTDLHVENRLNLESWSLRNQMSGGYRHSFVEGGGDETYVSSLFLEGEAHDYGLVASLGRRSRSSGGVLGRYDGAEATVELGEHWNLGLIGGLPVDSSRSGWGGFERYFGGASVEWSQIFGVLDVEVFGIGQAVGRFLDRAAVGAELRYFDRGRSLAAFLDYDVYYRSLNTAQLVATWQPFPSTYLTFFGDYRNVPTLTTRNALQGQGVTDLEGLEATFTRDEIEALAKDRTARSTNLTLSASQRLGDRYQLAFDVGTSHLSGMPASGGLDAFEGTGFEFNYNAQFIANDVLAPGDVGVVGLRFVDGKTADAVSGTLSARYPLMQRLRMTPRLRTDYRFERDTEDRLIVSPALRLDLEVWKLRFDTEAGLHWDLPQGGSMQKIDYFFTFGIRHDF